MTVAHNVLRNLNGYLADCNERVLRLFACALGRAVWHRLSERERYAVGYAEARADGVNVLGGDWQHAWSVFCGKPGYPERPFFRVAFACLCPSALDGAARGAHAFLAALAKPPAAVETRLEERHQAWAIRENNRITDFYDNPDEFWPAPPGEPEPLRPYQRLERRIIAACRILEAYASCIIFPRANWHLVGDVAGMLAGPEPHPVPTWLPAACVCEGDRVRKLARRIYVERAWHDLPVLADAIEEAGCPNIWLLEHCRKVRVHSRGCWVLDVLLGLTEPDCAPDNDDC